MTWFQGDRKVDLVQQALGQQVLAQVALTLAQVAMAQDNRKWGLIQDDGCKEEQRTIVPVRSNELS